eukprot:scaffold6091_cov32-Attheya_sp.AAC.1
MAFSTLWNPTFRPFPKDPVRTQAAKASKVCCWTENGTPRKYGSSWHMRAYVSHHFQLESRAEESTVASAIVSLATSRSHWTAALASGLQFANRMAGGGGNEQQNKLENFGWGA